MRRLSIYGSFDHLALLASMPRYSLSFWLPPRFWIVRYRECLRSHLEPSAAWMRRCLSRAVRQPPLSSLVLGCPKFWSQESLLRFPTFSRDSFIRAVAASVAAKVPNSRPMLPLSAMSIEQR
ncbi:hypothetical protein B0T26DRAFT_218970 [Lasiosphaeria miniovina]|uniref:Uncharacterized protein n=1 Tax=Lasiosphaeria miniovina TaxID=1954250 RepID=A0AA40E370_9PEZI|nr:uncharacterized protein B0T26DRAFT_218970 [Lasiosphaeria miniovina]KAK0722436.1 hypothetical protein B0T26DRAFT_218970 [Lasiosphaeria miniovina]